MSTSYNTSILYAITVFRTSLFYGLFETKNVLLIFLLNILEGANVGKALTLVKI